MNVEITNFNQSKIISKSKNLRSLLDYRKKDTAEHIRITNNGNGANFEVIFKSGNKCMSYFASFKLCKKWFKSHFMRYYEMIESGDEVNNYYLSSNKL